MSHAFFGKVEQWALASYLPTQANRDLQEFEKGWATLLHRVARSAEEVGTLLLCTKLQSIIAFIPQKGITTAITDMYKKMQEGGMSFVEFSHTMDEILFTNIGQFVL